MNVFEADIWASVYHGDKFSHTTIRYQLIHAMSEEQAKKKIILKPEKATTIGNGLTIKSHNEFIYALRQSGTVCIKPFYVYSDGRSSRPVNRRHGRDI